MKKIVALCSSLFLAACGMGTVGEGFEYAPAPETALLIYFEPSSNGAVMKSVDMETMQFKGERVAFSGAPGHNGGVWRRELVDRTPEKSDSYSQIFYRDTTGTVRYMGGDIKGFQVSDVEPGYYALTTRMGAGQSSYYCDTEGAAVYRIEPGKVNLVIGEFPYPLPAGIKAEYESRGDVPKLFADLKVAEKAGSLKFDGITPEIENRILAKLKTILTGYPNIAAEAVLAERVAAIDFDGKVSWFDGGGCPAEKTQPFTVSSQGTD